MPFQHFQNKTQFWCKQLQLPLTLLEFFKIWSALQITSDYHITLLSGCSMQLNSIAAVTEFVKKKMSGEFSIVLLYWRILCTGISSKILRCLTFCFRPHNLNILLLSESTAYLLQASTKPGSQLLAQEFSTVNKLYHLTSFSCHSLQKPLITN